MLNWFSKNKEEELAPLDFSVLKTDIHSHHQNIITFAKNDKAPGYVQVKGIRVYGCPPDKGETMEEIGDLIASST